MAQIEDIPILPPATTLSPDDFLAVIDAQDRRQAKRTTLNEAVGVSSIAQGVPVAAEDATVTLAPAGANNDIVLSAAFGVAKSAAIVTKVNSVELSVSFQNKGLTVTSGDKRRMILVINTGGGANDGTYPLVWLGSSWYYESSGFEIILSQLGDDGGVPLWALLVDDVEVYQGVNGFAWPDDDTDMATAGYAATASEALASEVITAINATDFGITAANAAANNGTGVIAAVAPQAFTDGVEASSPYPPLRVEGNTLYVFNATTGNWRSVATSAL